MRGLILNGFYSSIGNIKLLFAMVAVAAGAVIITGNPTAQELFVYITITALSVNAVVSSRKDNASKWNKYEITLPILRKDIIKSKYFAYALWVGVGTFTTLVVIAVTMLIHGDSNLLSSMENLYSMFALGIGIALLTGGLFYPASYMVGIDKSETILVLSILMAIGLAIVTLNTLNLFIFSFAVRIVVFIAFYTVFFLISYILTLCIFYKKEF